jgi:hypothetical protein
MADDLLFFPNKGYIKNNLAPEKIPRDYVRELASTLSELAQQKALKPGVDKYMLPLALTEREFSNYGNHGVAPTDPLVDVLYKKRLEEENRQRKEFYQFANAQMPVQLTVDSAKYLPPSLRTVYDQLLDPSGQYYEFSNSSLPDTSAAQAVSVFSQLLNKHKDPALAIERWNGKGRSFGTDASNHRKKVQEAFEMLNHPANKQLMEYFKQFRNPGVEYP